MCMSHVPTDEGNTGDGRIIPVGMARGLVWAYGLRGTATECVRPGLGLDPGQSPEPSSARRNLLQSLRLVTPDEMLGSQFIVQILEDSTAGRSSQPSGGCTSCSTSSEDDAEMLDDLQVQERLRSEQ